MQSKSQIGRKLNRIKFYYLKKRFERDLSRRPWNCTFNEVVEPTGLKAPELDDVEREIPFEEDDELTVPAKALPILVEAEPESSTRICMFGSEDQETWPGIICDEIRQAKQCPMFRLKHSREQVKESLDIDLLDEELVAREFKDIAALRWVLELPVGKTQLPWWLRWMADWHRPDSISHISTGPAEDEPSGEQLFLGEIMSMEEPDGDQPQ